MQQQRLLKNMGAHTVVLDLLQIPYEAVSGPENMSELYNFIQDIRLPYTSVNE